MRIVARPIASNIHVMIWPIVAEEKPPSMDDINLNRNVVNQVSFKCRHQCHASLFQCRLTKCPKRPVKLCYLNIKPWFLLNIDQAFFGNEIPMSTPPKKKSLRSWQICQELTWTRLINWTCFFAQETDKKIEDNQKEKHKRKYLR